MTTYYVDTAVGNDGNGGLAEGAGQAWATIDHAMNTVVAGDKVYVKASGTYTENPAIDTAGTLASPIVFEGYTSSPGDGGRATSVGEWTDTITGRLLYVIKNFDISNVGGAGAGKCVDMAGTNLVFKNCKFHDNNATGLVDVGTCAAFEKCDFYDGVGDGLICGAVVCVGCTFHDCSLAAIDCAGHGICAFCDFFSNGSQAIDAAPANDTFLVAINCTIDGDAKDTTDGIYKNGSFYGIVVAVNNIVYDCGTGLTWGPGGTANPEFGVSINNLVNSNTSNYTGGAFTSSGEVTGAPAFTDEANNDYSLGAASPARSAGFDMENNADIGAHQVTAAAGGGAGPANKRAGKQ